MAGSKRAACDRMIREYVMKVRGIGLTAMAAVWTACALSGQTLCDPHLLGPASDPYSYRLRGDRCEGVYIQEVAGAPLSIVSWTAAFPNYDLTSHQPLRLEWDLADSRERVRLRAQSLRRKLYYRMDALSQSGSTSYQWPLDLLAAIRIARDEIGVVGLAEADVGDSRREVYVPLRIAQSGKPPSVAEYHLVLLPGTELKEVFVTLVAAKGALVLKEGEPLGYGYYPAERPVDVPVAAPRESGIYRLEVGATHKSGGASTIELWFYHPGRH
jgi:hypothetical protein